MNIQPGLQVLFSHPERETAAEEKEEMCHDRDRICCADTQTISSGGLVAAPTCQGKLLGVEVSSFSDGFVSLVDPPVQKTVEIPLSDPGRAP